MNLESHADGVYQRSEIDLTIYVACYNRPDYAQEAIASVLDQTDQRFILRISDNSTLDGVQEMVTSMYPRVEYLRRRPSTTACIHGNVILAECQTPYVMIMHDDDLLSPDFVREMLEFIRKFPKVAGYASNALMIDDSKKVLRKYFFLSAKDHVLSTDPLWLLKRWFAYGTFSVAPLPSYIYSLSNINGLQFDTEKFGQFSDFVFIHQCIMRPGGLAWLNRPLYRYRVHPSQDSARMTFQSCQKLRRYVRTHHPDHYCSSSFKISRSLNLLNILRRSDKMHTKRKLKIIVIKALMLNPVSIANRGVLFVAERLSKWRMSPDQLA